MKTKQTTSLKIEGIKVFCHCGSAASLRSNSLIYNGREYGNGLSWICDRFPKCRGSVGTHPDGRPLGTIPDQETKKLRIKVHAVVDPLWKNWEGKKRSRGHARGSVYGWLRRITGKSNEQNHIGMYTKEDCIRTLKLIEENPYEERYKKDEAENRSIADSESGKATEQGQLQ